ncbi:family 16 glycosylhydrolase [Erythrobacter sp. HA6-11]
MSRRGPGSSKPLPEDGGTGGSSTGSGGSSGSGSTGSDGGTVAESDLAPIDLSDMRLYNWYGQWHASNWDNAWSSIPFRYDHVIQDESGDTHLIFDENGAPELKAQNGHPYSTKAFYEVDVTLPELRSGMVVAPLWLWHDHTRDEIDFEFVGANSLQLTIHSYRSGEHRSQDYRIEGNFSGQRMKLGIATDLERGEIDMLVNGQVVHTFYNNTNAFPTGEMRPVISMWVGDAVSWAEPWTGPWEGFAEGEQLVMTVHGYRFEQR